MLIMSPQETSDFIKKGSIDARAVILTFLDDGQARIAFRAREDKQVYVLEIKADEAWVRDFCLSEDIAVLMAANIHEFYGFGLLWWPADEGLQRMKAIVEFRAS